MPAEVLFCLVERNRQKNGGRPRRIDSIESEELTSMAKAEMRIGAVLVAVFLTLAASGASQDRANEIQELYSQSAANEKSGNIEEAINGYLKIIKLDPTLPAAY